jgi:2-keto-4-pentenoate hydratase/2-oxohepta-3-ene-1,7-dioic acid hydratase in catechol pathway
MKLAMFQVDTPIGPVARFGVVELDGDPAETINSARCGAGTITDVNAAFAGRQAERGHGDPTLRADAFCPADLQAYATLHETDLSLVEEALDWAHRQAGAPGPRGERISWKLSEVRLLPPITRVPVLRDFAAFEDHLEVTFSKMGIAIPAAWYEQPTAFKGNPTTLFGHDALVPWPRYTKKLDYELEIAAIIGRPGRDIPRDEAAKHILGYTLLNDFSARDTQRGEMQCSTGPYKGKDFAWGLGPWVVTPDELGDPSTLKMAVRVDGEIWAESTPGPMQWTFSEAVSYTSQDERLTVGEVLGSGTVNNGCGFEIDRWISPGATVELEADRIGVLRHRVGEPAGEPIDWRRSASAPRGRDS